MTEKQNREADVDVLPREETGYYKYSPAHTRYVLVIVY
jgi:hypothetical protein